MNGRDPLGMGTAWDDRRDAYNKWWGDQMAAFDAEKRALNAKCRAGVGAGVACHEEDLASMHGLFFGGQPESAMMYFAAAEARDDRSVLTLPFEQVHERLVSDEAVKHVGNFAIGAAAYHLHGAQEREPLDVQPLVKGGKKLLSDASDALRELWNDLRDPVVGQRGSWVIWPAKPETEWKFSANVDLDWRGGAHSVRDALDEAFRRTGVPREQFEVTRQGLTKEGKTIPVEYAVRSGPNRGAEVNIDIPIPDAQGKVRGPNVPHVGYQTPGKRGTGGRVRGHILLDAVPANR